MIDMERLRPFFDEGDGGSGGDAGAGGGESFDFRSLVADDGNFVEGWHDKLPDDVKQQIGDNKHLTKIGSPVQLATEVVGLSRFKGRQLLPDKDAEEGEWDKVLEQMGTVKDPADYGLSLDGIEDEQYRTVLEQDGAMDRLASVLHRAGLPKLLAGRVGTAIMQERALKWKEYQDNVVEHRERLEKQWGGKQQYDANIALGRRALESLGGEGMQEFLETLHVADHPIVGEFLHGLAKKMMPGVVVTGQGTGPKADPNDPDEQLKTLFPNTSRALGLR